MLTLFFFFKSQLLFIYSVFFNVLASLSHCSLPPLCFLFISSELFKFQVTSFIWHWHLLLLTRDGHVGNTLVVLSLWVCLHSLLIRHHDKLLFLIKMFELWTVENCFAALPKVLLFAAFLLLLSFWYVTLLIVRIFFFLLTSSVCYKNFTYSKYSQLLFTLEESLLLFLSYLFVCWLFIAQISFSSFLQL